MSIEVKQYNEERCALIKEQQALAVQVKQENREFTGEELQICDERNAKIMDLQGKIESAKRMAEIDALGATNHETEKRSAYTKSSYVSHPTAQDQKDGFRAWCLGDKADEKMCAKADRLGVNIRAKEWTPETRTAQTVGTNSTGGYTVPNDNSQYGYVTTALLQYNSVRQVAQVISTTTGNPLPFNTCNDTSNKGELLTEAGTYNAQAVALGQVKLGAYKFGSKLITVSAELLQDSAIDIEKYIWSLIGERLGRIEADFFTSGSGSSQPMGVVTAATTGVTTASTTAFTFAELVNQSRSIDPAYQKDASWLVSPAFWTACMLMVDDNGRPLLNSSLDGIGPNGWSESLLGKPVRVVNNMQNLSAGNSPAVYGIFNPYFVIRDAGPVRLFRANELYMANDEIGFVAFKRSDSNSIAAGSSYPFKKLTMAAS